MELSGVGVQDLLTAKTIEPAASRPVESAPSQPAEDASRPWATPMDLPGLPNLHKVSDKLYRRAQPTAEGMRELARLGVKTVVNLRSFHSDHDELAGTSLGYEHITMRAWHVEDKQTRRFLEIVTDPARTPVFVHCMHGADRTGTMCAAYRMAVQGWDAEEAIKEMTEGNFGFHRVWQNLIKYLRELDLDTIRPAPVTAD